MIAFALSVSELSSFRKHQGPIGILSYETLYNAQVYSVQRTDLVVFVLLLWPQRPPVFELSAELPSTLELPPTSLI